MNNLCPETTDQHRAHSQQTIDCNTYACPVSPEKLIAKEDPGEYSFINQGCLDVDGMDDKEEMRLTDVCRKHVAQKLTRLRFTLLPQWAYWID